MDNKIFTTVMMSSRRPKSLKRAILQFNKLAKYPDNVEFIINFDEDDDKSIEMFKTDDDLNSLPNIRIFTSERVGYNYLFLAMKHMISVARGDILIPTADDCFITMDSWDDSFLQFKDQEVLPTVKNRLCRFVFTKTLIKKHKFIRDYANVTHRADIKIARYATHLGLLAFVPYWYVRVKCVGEELDKWELKDLSILDNLEFKELEIKKEK